jgi:MFS family permease
MKLYKGFSRDFWLMCLASLFFFASFNMIIPELPAMLRGLGGESYLGWNIAAFSLIALISRPFSGLFTDKVGRIPVMVFGASVAVVVGLIYPFVASVLFYFILRGAHGLGAGFTPTANVAYIDDVVPSNRKGEAMGMVGISNVVGMSAGPPIGSWISEEFSLDATFFVSSAFALIAAIIFIKMNETLEIREKLNKKLLKWENLKFFEKNAMTPSIVMLFTVYSFGSLLTIGPDYAVFHGFKNKGIFFTYLVLASLLSRVVAGTMSDKHGRRKMGIVGCALLTIGMVYLATSQSRFDVVVSAVILGFGQGFLSPILFAWATDLADPKNKGKAISTLYVFLEIGIIFGSLVPGYIFNNNSDNFKWAFFSSAIANFLAFVYLTAGLINRIYKKRKVY